MILNMWQTKLLKVIPKDYELMMQKLNYKVVICHNLMMLNWQHSMMNARQLNKITASSYLLKKGEVCYG